jgi:Tat protein translocase TatB subunit
MFGLSIGEILILAALALIIIGPEDLPKIARQIGRFVNDIKRTTQGFAEDLKEQAKFDPKDFLKQKEEYNKHISPQVIDSAASVDSDSVDTSDKEKNSVKGEPS